MSRHETPVSVKADARERRTFTRVLGVTLAGLALSACSHAEATSPNTDVVVDVQPVSGVSTHEVPVHVTPDPVNLPSATSIPNASFEESLDGTKPAGWTTSAWGDNKPTFEYVSGDAHTGDKSALLKVADHKEGDARWSFTPITNLAPDRMYSFTDWYKTNADLQVVVEYTTTANETKYRKLPNPSKRNAEGDWQKYDESFYLPKDATSVTISMLLPSDGWVQVDDYDIQPYEPTPLDEPVVSLTFDDGWKSIHDNGLPLLREFNMPSTQYIVTNRLNTEKYMTTDMVREFQQQGSEIGSHTVSHPDLTTLPHDAMQAELTDSQAQLRQLFGEDVARDLASPEGMYNDDVLDTADDLYTSHRSTDVGFNERKNFDRDNILVQNIGPNTTPEMFQAWIDEAKRTSSWLVLVYHQVLPNAAEVDYAVTPDALRDQLQTIVDSGIKVETVSQALSEVEPQVANQPTR